HTLTILSASCVTGTREELLVMTKRVQAAIMRALRGQERDEYDRPNPAGMTGLLGFTPRYRAMHDAGALLIVGTDLPYRQCDAEDVPVIQIDSRGEQIGKRVPVEVPLVGTAKDTIRELLPLLKPAKSSRHLSKMLDHYKKTRAKLDDLARPSRGSRPIHPQYLTRVLDEKANDDAVFIPDVGSPVVYASRYLHTTEDRRVIGSFAH